MISLPQTESDFSYGFSFFWQELLHCCPELLLRIKTSKKGESPWSTSIPKILKNGSISALKILIIPCASLQTLSAVDVLGTTTTEPPPTESFHICVDLQHIH